MTHFSVMYKCWYHRFKTEAAVNHNFHVLQHFFEDSTLFNEQDLEVAKHSLSQTLPTQCLFLFQAMFRHQVRFSTPSCLYGSSTLSIVS